MNSDTIVEKLNPLDIEIRKLRSKIDSFNFEISGHIIHNNLRSIDQTCKQFYRQFNKTLGELSQTVYDTKVTIAQMELTKNLKRQETRLEMLETNKIQLEEKIKNLINENLHLNKKINQIHLDLFVKDEECELASKKLMVFQDVLYDEKENLGKLISEVENEKKELRGKLEMKDSYIYSRFSEKHSQEQELKDMKLKIKEKDIDLKEKQSVIDELKREINKFESLEKIDKRNLIEQKIQLKESLKKSGDYEDQLKDDYQLILRLKTELENQKLQSESLINDKADLYGRIDEMKAEKQDISEEIEKKEQSIKEMDELLITLTETNLKVVRKNKMLKKLAYDKNSELEDLKKNKLEMEKSLEKLQKDLSEVCDKYNHERVQSEMMEKQVKSLTTLRQINDEKIALLLKFIEDYQLSQRESEIKLLRENFQIQTKMNMISLATQKFCS